MKYFIFILAAILIISCKSKFASEKSKQQKETELKPPFSNQGEQEYYWAQEFFKENYNEQTYSVYRGDIKIADEHTLIYGNKTFNIYAKDTLKLIFLST